MNILLTNDDGIHGEGLISLKEALSNADDIHLTVIAPDRERSASSHQITIFEPLIIKEVQKNTYTLNGSPADCVKVGLEGFLKHKIDLVISGINNGPNMGIDIYYSGTVAAAREACFHNVPAIALSLDGYGHEKNYSSATYHAINIIRKLKSVNWPEKVIFNINIPNIDRDSINGTMITSLGNRVYRDRVIERESPFGWKYFWIGGDLPSYHYKEESDFMAIENNYISITPLKLDLTDHSIIDTIKKWDL